MLGMITPITVLVLLTTSLTLMLLGRAIWGKPWRYSSYLGYFWAFYLAFTVVELGWFRAGNWIVAVISFLALREYFSLIDLRLQDRLAVWAAYASIPFMFHFVLLEWYGMFIVSIPVYAFLAIPFLITVQGRETEGTVFSIGIIDFGLFLFVYCMGHISYLMLHSAWQAVLLISGVVVSDMVADWIRQGCHSEVKRCVLQAAVAIPLVMALNAALAQWAGIPLIHALVLGGMIPLLVQMGRRTGEYVEADLGIREDTLFPGRGQILDNLKSLLFTAPIVFHYLRYFLK